MNVRSDWWHLRPSPLLILALLWLLLLLLLLLLLEVERWLSSRLVIGLKGRTGKIRVISVSPISVAVRLVIYPRLPLTWFSWSLIVHTTRGPSLASIISLLSSSHSWIYSGQSGAGWIICILGIHRGSTWLTRVHSWGRAISIVKSCRIRILILLITRIHVKLGSFRMRSPEYVLNTALVSSGWNKVCISVHIIDTPISNIGFSVEFILAILIKDYSISSVYQVPLFSFIYWVFFLSFGLLITHFPTVLT